MAMAAMWQPSHIRAANNGGSAGDLSREEGPPWLAVAGQGDQAKSLRAVRRLLREEKQGAIARADATGSTRISQATAGSRPTVNPAARRVSLQIGVSSWTMSTFRAAAKRSTLSRDTFRS